MKAQLVIALALSAATALASAAEPLPIPEPGRLLPARLSRERIVLRDIGGRIRCDSAPGQRHMPVGMVAQRE